MAEFNLFNVPEYYTGLLGQEQTDKLKRQALGTGITNALLAFVAQPRTEGYGSALPYLGRALMAGQQSGQDVIAGGLRDFETQQRIAEMKRKQEQQQALQTALGGITDPNERLFAQIAPEQYVAGKVKQIQTESPFAKIDRKDYTSESFRKYLETKNLADLEPIQKEGKQSTLLQLQNELDSFPPNDPRRKVWEKKIELETTRAPGINVNYGAPIPGVDVNTGQPVFFQPSKTGGAPTIVPGVAPEGKAATESQAKAAAFGSQMKSASQEFEQIQAEGFAPGATKSQVGVELAGTPLRGLADPLAQRAQQSQAQWAEAYLRYKTGAAATEAEVRRNIATFFPKIGETDPKVIEQKARMRRQAEEDVLKSAKQTPGQKQQQPRSRADILQQYGL